ncbi:MAG TPA: carbamoyltransferase C-terminal domain-containing protein [Alphaproteobacteria bacterium]|nr:carbamoyltransferase C-terminal domain-containing protein [Alphaproteobacteria bacterium]
MIILGIADHVNSGAAIIIDGRVVAAVNEERLVRKKMVFGVPRKSIATVLELAGVRPNEVDYVAIATINGHLINDYIEFKGWFQHDRGMIKQLFFASGSKLSRLRPYIPFLENLYYRARNPVFAHRRTALKTILQEEFDVRCPVHFLDHHFAHACSAYFSSGFDEALLVTMDGGGDGVSSQVYEASGGTLTKLHEVSSFNSLGNYYAYITHLCGFQAGKHEGKVTGLAAFGEPCYQDVLNQLITYENGTIVNTGNLFFQSALRGIAKRLPKSWDRKDLAASIQCHAENLVRQYVGYWQQRTQKKDVALAGGLFANVKINQRVHELHGVERVLIHPGMTDEGLPVGAALALNYQLAKDYRGLPRQCFDHVYLGPSYSDEDMEKALAQAGIPYRRSEQLEEDIAEFLTQGYVVARFSGPMEYGPRALGNRSILYKPSDPSVNDWLNKCLRRTEFMPFAPSTLTEEASTCFHNVDGAEDTARFMTITFDCTPWMTAECGGVVHVDGTARPQLVSRQDNPSYYKIIDAYRKKTGMPCIVNTSFNIHEEPIVCSPQDAIRAFQMGHLDILAMGNFLAINQDVLQKPRGGQVRQA